MEKNKNKADKKTTNKSQPQETSLAKKAAKPTDKKLTAEKPDKTSAISMAKFSR